MSNRYVILIHISDSIGPFFFSYIMIEEDLMFITLTTKKGKIFLNTDSVMYFEEYIHKEEPSIKTVVKLVNDERIKVEESFETIRKHLLRM